MNEFSDVPTHKLARQMDDLAEARHRPNWTIIGPIAFSLLGILIGIYGLAIALIRSGWAERAPILIGGVSVALLLNSMSRERAQARRLNEMAEELYRRR